MKEPVRNVAPSIQARLKNESERLRRPFAEILQYYVMERFLFRLARTKYATKFVLKGGLLFYVWNVPLRRPTRDIDFRGYVTNNRDGLLQIFKEIALASVPDDGIIFDPDSISIEDTQPNADYQGSRANLTAFLGRSKIHLQIDIGFSDELASKAEALEYPHILPDVRYVRLMGYPKESVVAEKFHAMIRFGDLNSRMKDFYDLWLMSGIFEFEGQSLKKAMETTFENRDTGLPVERPASLTVEFASRNQTRWGNFLKKMDLENKGSDDFADVVEQVWKFIQVPLQSSLNKTRSTRKWTPQKGWK
jgi:hypothetical protein